MSLKENEILNGENFSLISDHIYAKNYITENLTAKVGFPTFNLNNVKENDVIFCKTDFISSLFDKLENFSIPIKLITHESDFEINKNTFEHRPNCIKKWFAINVNYKHSDLIPIPLGLANKYCKITLKENDLNPFEKKNKLLYINHRIETNLYHRSWIYNWFETNNWCTVDKPNLSLEEFSKQISQHQFMLCPRGNGIDTHRLWECLYSNVIPIVENNIHYEQVLQNIPAIIVDSFKEVDEDFLLSKLLETKHCNLEKLNINWWKNYIKEL